MKLNVIFALAAAMLTAVPAYAGTQLPAQTLVYVGAGWIGEGIYVRTAENLLADACTMSVAVLVPNNVLFNENLSLLLSAFHANSKVRLYVDGCIGDKMALKAVAIEK